MKRVKKARNLLLFLTVASSRGFLCLKWWVLVIRTLFHRAGPTVATWQTEPAPTHQYAQLNCLKKLKPTKDVLDIQSPLLSFVILGKSYWAGLNTSYRYYRVLLLKQCKLSETSDNCFISAHTFHDTPGHSSPDIVTGSVVGLTAHTVQLARIHLTPIIITTTGTVRT